MRQIIHLFLLLAITNTIMSAEASENRRVDVFPLDSNRYYFIGNDTGWAQKTQASHGIRHQLKFKVSDVDNDKYSLIVESSSAKAATDLFYREFKIFIRNNRTSSIVLSTSFNDKLQDATNTAALTARPYLVYEDESPAHVLKYTTLKVISLPYVSVNNDSRSIVIASAKHVKELANFIRIPKTFVLYEWNFPFTLD